MSDLLREYDESTKKKSSYAQIFRVCFLSLIVIVGAIYSGDTFFGQYPLDTMLSLELMKRELNRQILFPKEQNVRAQKEYFGLQGLDPDEKK